MFLNILNVTIVIFYSVSVFGFFIDFIDFIQHNQKVKQLAFWFLSIVWGLLTISLLINGLEQKRLPMMTVYEFMFLYVWILVTFSIIIRKFVNTDFWMLFVNLIGFCLLTISIFAPASDVSSMLSELLVLELLVIHVTFLLLSYGSFTLSFVFSLLYFLQHRLLKQKKWNKMLIRNGDLSRLEKFSYLFSLIGSPLMILGLLQGIIWAWLKFHAIPWYDFKVINSFIVLICYGTYLFHWTVRKRRGYQLALFNMASFLLLIINYFLSSSYSSFHIW